MSDELKSCPWPECGNSIAIALEKGFLDYGYYVFCPLCAAAGPAAQTEAEAVRLWNTMQRKEKQEEADGE